MHRLKKQIIKNYQAKDITQIIKYIQLREVFGFGYTIGIQREKDACFLFSQVQSFKNGIAYPFRSECADMESKGYYRFKVVNLHTAIIGYPYASPYPVFP